MDAMLLNFFQKTCCTFGDKKKLAGVHKCFLLLGSDKGDRQSMIVSAIELISMTIGEIRNRSSFYLTEPWGFISENDFLNCAVEVATEKSPEELLASVLEIETALGRTRPKESSSYLSRYIDIDILFYDTDIIGLEHLQIPHPKLHERRFALIPMHEIAPDRMHPVFKKTIADLLRECSDMLSVTKVDTRHQNLKNT